MKKKDQRTEEIAKFSLMDYTFLNIINSADKNSEIIGKLNVWIVNSFINKEEIMAMLKKKKINNIMCLIVVDLARPWKIKESINKWTAFIQEVFKDEQSDIMEIMQKNVEKRIKLYQEPETDDDGNLYIKELTPVEQKEKLKAPLKEGLLQKNIGIPLVYVMNKSDVVLEERKKQYETFSEFILSHVRQMAIEYGATIIYTSGKSNTNLSILYDYICHTLFNFDLLHKPNLIEKEAYFIPAGYDNLSILNSNEETKRHLEDYFELKILSEDNNKNNYEEDIQCEDINTFFEILQKSGVKGKENKSKNKIKESSPPKELKKKPEVKIENKIPEKKLENYKTHTKINKDKRFADTQSAILEKLKKDKEKKSIATGKAQDDKSKKTKESMLAKLKLKKEQLKKK